MRRIAVELGCRSYEVVVGGTARELAAAALPAHRMLITDSTVAKLHGDWAKTALAPDAVSVFPAGEESKNFLTVENFCRDAARHRLDRKCAFVALGGGVTGDLAGFAAAIYLRGVDFYQIPTTLLAMIDSSVGGKTGADLPEGKNLIGAFHQPRGVFIDPGFLATLPPRELANGLAEMIKTAIILDAGLLAELEKSPSELLGPSPRYTDLIARCCELKGGVVAADECEAGRRAILNYGHTVGHAVEMLSSFTVPHGAAVAIGMAAAAKIAVAVKRMSPDEAARQNALLTAFGLPLEPPAGQTPGALLDAMRRDKKNRDGKVVFVLPEGIGRASTMAELPEKLIVDTLKSVCR